MAIRLGATALQNLMLGTAAVQKVFLGTYQVWANEIVVTLSNRSTFLYLKSLFTSSDWASTTRKRVVIPAGVQIGTASSFAIAISATADGQATSFGGELIIDNYGTVSGIGGAPNSGAGGDAILANLLGRTGQKLIINNYGTLRAGGGGGGRAGNGGAGQVPYTYREPSSGWRYDPPNYTWHGAGSYSDPYWGGLRGRGPGGATSVTLDGWTYLRGPFVVNSGTVSFYQIARQQTRQEPTAGGVAGDGGKGQGFDGAATAGANPVAGGTNAGNSGKSGNGGSWGANGQAGANGAAGNAGAGAAGAAAGLAGAYLNGSANAVLNNQGTLQGRIV